ncbi:MAG: FUSC family protein [Actinomycetales bacterium]
MPWRRRITDVLVATDPGLQRLRTAATGLASLVSALVLVVLLLVVWPPAASAGPRAGFGVALGVVVAMVAGMAVQDPDPRARAVTVLLLVPPAAVTAVLAALLQPHRVLADAALVAVAVAAVYLRLLGPRGLAMGMVAFIAYFMTLFLRLPLAALPRALVALVLGAVASAVVGYLLRPRRPARDVRRMLSSLALRHSGVLAALARTVEDPNDARSRQQVRDRLGRAGEAAFVVEQQLANREPAPPLFADIDDEALAATVFDAQLALEELVRVASSGRTLPTGEAATPVPNDAARARVSASLRDLRLALRTPTVAVLRHLVRHAAAGQTAAAAGDHAHDPAEQLLDRRLQALAETWQHLVDATRHPADARAEADGETPDSDVRARSADSDVRAGSADSDVRAGSADSDAEKPDTCDGPSPVVGMSRTALQVALATALSVAAGLVVSQTRWFWAAITAFVVFIGAETRGEILSKGWQRILGTLTGVVAGVVVAELVGRDAPVAIALVLLCLFLTMYVIRVSQAWGIFFITTMLALLYDLLGQFSVGLLVVRLEETAIGAVIGVAVSFLVLPRSTREALREAIATYLERLDTLLDEVGHEVVDGGTDFDQTRALDVRESFDALKLKAKPLTQGPSGLDNRAAHRRLLQAMGAIEEHARVLARLASSAAGLAAEPALAASLGRAVHAVRAEVSTVAEVVRVDGVAAGVRAATESAGERDPGLALSQFESDVLDCHPEQRRRRLLALHQHLAAIDQSLRSLQPRGKEPAT